MRSDRRLIDRAPAALAALLALGLAACSSAGSMDGGAIPQTQSAPMPGDDDQSVSPDASADADTPATSASPAPAPTLSGAVQPQARTPASRPVCPAASRRGYVRCFSWVRVDVAQTTQADLLRAHATPEGFAPATFWSAYDLPSAARGKGRTVAIVDAFGYARAASDLAVYRSTYHLPPCTQASGCLHIVNERGAASPLPPEPTSSDDWRPEQALDLDTVSAICPNCKIVLVQTVSDRSSDMYAGVDAAARRHPDAISNSWGGAESSASAPAFQHAGVAIVASAGDQGAGAQQPCSFAGVVCVGGTSLQASKANARGWRETVWHLTGSGCSAFVRKPAWQHDKGCAMRSEADVSANADPDVSPIAVYLTSAGYRGWAMFGGTSESAPLIAAVYALAGNARSIDAPRRLWHNAGKGLFPVVKGNNDSARACSAKMRYICYAGAGYDGPSGWGTPDGVSAF